MRSSSSLLVLVNLLSFSTCSFAGFGGFDFEDKPTKPVSHAGALIIKKYSKNDPDGAGEQLCLLLGHDRNFDSWAPPAGGVDAAKDFEIKQGKPYYSSLKTIQREVLEETGGLVNINDAQIKSASLLYSPKFHDLLAVIRDDSLSCPRLIQSVQQSIADPHKDKAWKEMDNYAPFPINNIFAVAQVMRTHFDSGGNINNLPATILSPRKTNLAPTPLVYVETRSGHRLELCAYYMGAIADVLPQLQAMLTQSPPVIHQPPPVIQPNLQQPVTISANKNVALRNARRTPQTRATPVRTSARAATVRTSARTTPARTSARTTPVRTNARVTSSLPDNFLRCEERH